MVSPPRRVRSTRGPSGPRLWPLSNQRRSAAAPGRVGRRPHLHPRRSRPARPRDLHRDGVGPEVRVVGHACAPAAGRALPVPDDRPAGVAPGLAAGEQLVVALPVAGSAVREGDVAGAALGTQRPDGLEDPLLPSQPHEGGGQHQRLAAVADERLVDVAVELGPRLAVTAVLAGRGPPTSPARSLTDLVSAWAGEVTVSTRAATRAAAPYVTRDFTRAYPLSARAPWPVRRA